MQKEAVTENTGKQKHPFAKNRWMLTFILLVLTVFTFLYGLVAGSLSFSVREMIEGIGDEHSTVHRIVWDLRIPRVLIGFLVGMCLATSGSLLQGVMRNPLADPGIIGVSSGAGLVATIIIILFPQHMALLPLGAFLGALVTALLIYGLSWKKGASPSRIILVGISINALIGALMSALMLLHSDKVQSVLPWLAGGISGVGWAHVHMIVYYAVGALLLAFLGIKQLRVLMLGDEMAKLLGHNVERSRFFLIVVSTLLAGIAVSVSGLIGFIGLIVPHTIRLLVGNDDRYVVPLSCLGGGILLVCADAIARSWFDPIELPVGILLSFLGGPFFLLLVQKGGDNGAKR
ncbi:iron ABC transporter permease [Bacillus sp. REN10]|uniref:FecCD family ABC transporter permease n=1 Tax=Bacillus sp. REN10 TaxID=2782541 RepID=UPI001EEE55D2|nr:iron ABC transporter permease [Bacillus sp. REN10]